MANHGVNVNEVATSLAAPTAAATGIPFFVGCAPIHTVESPAPLNVPVLITSWDEYKEKLGYCEDWANFQLCEAAYSHFVDFGMQPAIFVNVFDPATHKAVQAAANKGYSTRKLARSFVASKPKKNQYGNYVVVKPVGSDEKNHKLTYVTAHGLEDSAAEVERLSKEAVSIIRELDLPDPFQQMPVPAGSLSGQEQ